MTEFSELLGKALIAIEGGVGDDVVRFVCADGSAYRQYHSQDCCENVEVNEIYGDFSDLLGSPILLAEEVTYGDEPAPNDGATGSESYTWTFYKLRTLNGDVTIRWLGESNGYYSESVYFEKE